MMPKGGPGEIDAGAPYQRVRLRPTAARRRLSNTASPGYYYTIGPPPFTGATPKPEGTRTPGQRAFVPRTTFVRSSTWIVAGHGGRASKMQKTRQPRLATRPFSIEDRR